MEQISEILFICLSLPLIFMLFILPDKRSRLFLGYMLIGSLVCMISGAVNALLLDVFEGDLTYVTTTISPIIEEIMKALPVLYFAVFFSDDREMLLPMSFSLGIGFAVLEDAVILAQNMESISIVWAFVRVVGAALMHGACTAMIGMGMSYVRKRKKLFFCGTTSLLITAIIFHATFNVLAQSSLRIAALLLPISIYIPVVTNEIIRRRKKRNTSK